MEYVAFCTSLYFMLKVTIKDFSYPNTPEVLILKDIVFSLKEGEHLVVWYEGAVPDPGLVRADDDHLPEHARAAIPPCGQLACQTCPVGKRSRPPTAAAARRLRAQGVANPALGAQLRRRMVAGTTT